MATRQDVLFAAEDYTAVYQSFAQANFKAYDFDTIKSAMVDYIRLNYPEDYNDWIQSSEFVSLIDLIAYLGHSLAFRIDFSSRENFMETATSRESVLRLARFLGYNPKRSLNSKGVAKVKSVKTTEILIDSDGNNLSNVEVLWNDATNANAYEQFLLIVNSVLTSTNQFGSPFNSGTYNGIKTEIYTLNSLTGQDVVYPFNANVNGVSTGFEVCNVNLDTAGYVEPYPDPNASFKCVYLNDGKGNASENTGFFFYFKQGTLAFKDVLITSPIENQVIDVNVNNVVNDDVWVQSVAQSGSVSASWTKVPVVTGSNVIFNSIDNSLRNIFEVVTRVDDQISIKFADGRFGNAPKDVIRTWYRTGNNESYIIRPEDMQNINIVIPYFSRNDNQLYDLTVVLDLQETVQNSTETESLTSIQTNAPQVYATQDRMVTAEDYAVYPLQASTNIKKIKSTNRIHSGHTRYVDINDPTGTYKDLTIFGDDGYIYLEDSLLRSTLSTTSTLTSSSIIEQYIESYLNEKEVENFYYQKYSGDYISSNYLQAETSNIWTWARVTGTNKMSTGYFQDDATTASLGTYTIDAIGKYLVPGANIEFVQPDTAGTNAYTASSKTEWASIVSVSGDGRGVTDTTLAYTGKTAEGLGAIQLSRNIPSGYRIKRIAPAFNKKFTSTERTNITTQLDANNSFGLYYNHTTMAWTVVPVANLGASRDTAFDLSTAGDGSNGDHSWMLRIEKEASQWVFLARAVKFNFGSVSNVRFYNQRLENKVSKLSKKSVIDAISILKLNSVPLTTTGGGTGSTLFAGDYKFDISGYYTYDDGYTDPRRVLLKFADDNKDSVIDDPFAFDSIVGSNTIFITDVQDGNYTYKTLMTEPPPLALEYNAVASYGVNDVVIYNGNYYKALQTSTGNVPTNTTYWTPANPSAVISWSSAQVYSINDKVEYEGSEYKSLANNNLGSLPTNTTYWEHVRTLTYKSYTGRSNLNFKWTHAASEETRIDPAVTNIIDTFVLTNTYYTSFSNWLKNDRRTDFKPLPHTTEDLKNMFTSIESSKTSSDTIIYKPCEMKILFGAEADYALQARFKVVKNSTTSYTDNEIKALIVGYIDEYFDPANWAFGETFYFTELAGYVHRKMIGIVSSIVIVPNDGGSRFGNMFQVTPNEHEIFISAAKVSDIDIVSSYTESNIRIAGGTLDTASGTTSITGVTTSTSSTSSSSSGSGGSGSSGSGGGGSSYY